MSLNIYLLNKIIVSIQTLVELLTQMVEQCKNKNATQLKHMFEYGKYVNAQLHGLLQNPFNPNSRSRTASFEEALK